MGFSQPHTQREPPSTPNSPRLQRSFSVRPRGTRSLPRPVCRIQRKRRPYSSCAMHMHVKVETAWGEFDRELPRPERSRRKLLACTAGCPRAEGHSSISGPPTARRRRSPLPSTTTGTAARGRSEEAQVCMCTCVCVRVCVWFENLQRAGKKKRWQRRRPG